jgi:DNA-binding CsgD family transcriptional regulator
MRRQARTVARLGHCDLRALSRFLLDLHASTDVEAFSRSVVRGLRRLIAAHRCSFNYFDPVTGRVAWIADGADEPCDPDIRDGVAADMHDHPIVVHVRRTGERHFLRLSDHIAKAAFHRTTLYNNWYRHCRTEHQLVALFPSDRGEILGVALSRDGQRDFGERDRALGNAFVPHLVAGYRAAHRARRVQQEIAQLSQGLESAKAGVMLLTEDGRGVRLATDLARRWLGRYFGDARRRASSLPAAVSEWLAHCVSAYADTDLAGRPRTPLVVAATGRRLVIELLGTRPHLMLLLAEELDELPLRVLRPLGLTPRETEVLQWVTEGKRDGEVAAILGLSPRTVQHHLERIYRKLGVETRTAAAARAREAATTRSGS